MLKKIRFYLLAALALSLLLFTACSDDSSSNSDDSKKGVARYTVIIYGHNGGNHDHSIDSTMRDIQGILGEKEDVRVLLVYKYGGSTAFDGKLAYPGQMLHFEITKDTDLSKLKDSSAIVKDSIKLYDPEYITSVINYAHDSLPAQDYILFFEGHGSGFNFVFDYPKSERSKSTALAKQTEIFSLIQDNWIPAIGGGETITMKEIATGIKKSKVSHFKAIAFNVCLMGNIESLDEIYSYTDYFLYSEHSLISERAELITTLIENLTKNENDDFEYIVKAMLENRDLVVYWQSKYVDKEMNGDYQFIKTDKFANLNPIFKKLSNRLIELYAKEKNRAAIDKAANSTYRIDPEGHPILVDAIDYANKLAEETKDETLKKIAKELGQTYDSLTVTAMEAHDAENPMLNHHFSISVVLVDSATYNEEMSPGLWGGKTNRDSYKLTTFHKETGWGNWLNKNTNQTSDEE